MLKVVNLTVNGMKKQIAADERECLTDVLRDQLGLKSVKKGCEVGECGACAVLLDGKTINSCIYPAVLADGHEIVTVEGLNQNGALHPVQEAFIEYAAVQCGFCTPGMVLAGVELYNSGKHYTREEIQEHIAGHLCRCTGYVSIIDAIFSLVGKE